MTGNEYSREGWSAGAVSAPPVDFIPMPDPERRKFRIDLIAIAWLLCIGMAAACGFVMGIKFQELAK
jgi:hypothetical protein